MTENGVTSPRRKHKLGRIFAVAGGLAFLVLIAGYLLVAAYLRTPSAARQASRLLSAYLQTPVAIDGLGLSGGTFSVSGLAVSSPAGFTEREIVAFRRIAITPGWRFILHGGKSIDEISVVGLRTTIDRNRKGEWNFTELTRRFAGKKGGGETFIKKIAVADSALSVEGILLDNLALTVTDFSTRGSTGSRLLLTFKDAGGTPVRLEGGARIGSAPSLDLVLSASSFPLKNYSKYVRKWPNLDLERGSGALSLALGLHDGKIAVQGKMGCDHVTARLGKGAVPLQAELEFRGGYDTQRDEATLDSCALSFGEAIRMQATGTARQVRKTRDFAVAVSFTETDMGKLLAMLPPELRGNITAAGTLTSSGFRFSGSAAHGITAGKGQISLLRGALTWGGKSIAKNLAAAVSLERVREGWELHGVVTEGAGAGGDMVQGLEARFNALLSSGMKPLQAEIPSFAATLSGIALQGKLGYQSGSPEPVALSLRVDKAPVIAVNRYLAGGRATFSAGTMALDLQATGRGGRDFRGKLRGGLTGIRGSADGKDFTVREGVINAGFSSIGGKLSSRGDFKGSGSLPGGKPVQVASAFDIRDRELSLSDGTVVYDRARLRFASIRGYLPAVIREGELTRLPLHLHFEGISGERGDAGIGGLTGDLAGDFVTGRGKRWIAGNGNLTVTRLVFKGREAGSLTGRLKFTESHTTARIEGKLLGGRLEGTADIDPFAAMKKAGFSLNLEGAHCADLFSFLPAQQSVKCGGGLAGVKLTGEYAANQGVQYRVEANGTGIVLSGKDGGQLLADGALHAVCDVTRDSLVIREGSVGAGNGVTLRVRGEVARFLAADRAGEVSLQLSETPVASLVAAFGAVLPQGFRDATASGTFGAQGTLRISHTTVMLDGEASLAKAGIEVPAQRVSASDISGAVPFSLVIAGAVGPVKNQQRDYSRENYPALLSSLRQAAKSGHTFHIGKLRFSGLEFADTALGIRAGSGLIELTVLESKFLEGSLLGRGFFRYGKNIQYGGDLLLNELSLRALCDSFPKIKGYISGRMDGMIDLHGEGKGLSGLIGIVNIWTRSVPKEKMLVSKEFLQKLAGQKLKGIFFRNDRPYDTGEIRGYLEKGYLVFNVLDISHTNFFGIRDLSVSVAPVQNKIAIEHLFASIKEAATRGKAAGGGKAPAPAAPPPADAEFKWEE